VTNHEDRADPAEAAAVLRRLLDAIDRREITATATERARLEGAVAVLELQKISRERVRVWHAGLVSTDRPGASTAAKVYRPVRAILTTAVEDGHLVSNPCQIRGAGQEPAAERPELSLSDALSIAESVPARWRCVVLTAVWCGLRFGELAALTRADVDTLHRVIHVRTSAAQVRGQGRVVGRPKSAAGTRMVAIPPHLVPELEAHAATYSAPGATG
jgi:integrase